MDHNWGRQVFLCGLGDTGATLAARFRTFPHIVLTNGVDPLSVGHLMWYTFPDREDVWVPSHIGSGSLHFPYGLGDFVELDFPV